MQPTRVEPDDLARLAMDTAQNPMVVTAVLRLAGRLDPDELVALVETRLRAEERMRARVVRSGLFRHAARWEEESGDARRHVGRLALRERPLADAIADLAAEPLDPESSPWRVWLVDERERSTLVFRIHHALADGVALLRLLFAFSDEGATIPPPEAPSHAPRRHPSRVAAIARLLRQPPDRRSHELSGRKRIAWTGPIDLESVRDAAHGAGARVNDFFLGALAGALREVLPPAEVAHALVPVALPHDGERLGNRYVSLFVPLAMQGAPVERVRAARDAMRDGRAASGVTLGRSMIAGASLLGAHAERLAVRALSRKASLVATNLAGPPVPLHLAGRAVGDVFFAAPAPGSVGISANAFSYAGSFRVTVACDVAACDPTRLASLVERELRAGLDALRDYASRQV